MVILIFEYCTFFLNANTPVKTNNVLPNTDDPEVHMKRALKMIVDGKSLRSVSKSSGISKSALNRAFRRLIPKRNSLNKKQQKLLIEKNMVLPRLGNPEFTRYLSDDEESYVAEIVTNMCMSGFGLDRDQVSDLVCSIARAVGHSKAVCGNAFLSGFMKRNKLRSLKSSRIDFKRVEKATVDVRDKQFGLFEGLLDRMVEAGAMTKEQRNDPLFMKKVLFNLDEWSDDAPCGKRTKKISKRLGKMRVSDICDGDRSGHFHASVGVVTCGDGTMMPPIIIHSGSTNLNPSAAKLKNLPANWSCVVTKNGSMTLESFQKFCEWWPSSLPGEYGVGKLPVILILDGHSSRWTYQGLQYLQSKNVYPFCLASHTTAWGQPNDCGVNSSLKSAYAKVVKYWRLRNIGMTMVVEDFNELIVKAYEIFKAVNKKKKGGLTLIERAYKRTGFSPVDRNCENWLKAIDQFGAIANALQGKKVSTGSTGTREVRSVSRGYDEHAKVIVYPVRDSRSIVLRQIVKDHSIGFLNSLAERTKKKKEGKKRRTTGVNSYYGLDIGVAGQLAAIKAMSDEREKKKKDEEEKKKKRKEEAKKKAEERVHAEAEKKKKKEAKRKRKAAVEAADLREAQQRRTKKLRLHKKHHVALLRDLSVDVDVSQTSSKIASIYTLQTSTRGSRRRQHA